MNRLICKEGCFFVVLLFVVGFGLVWWLVGCDRIGCMCVYLDFSG